jgi:CRP/FNR family transcriptional regulator, anaerobic regulatory protein
MKLSERLSKSPYFFKGSNSVFFDWFLKLVYSRKVKKGEFIIEEGEICDKLYYIEKGLVRIYRIEGDKEITTWFTKEGDFVTTVNSFHFGLPSKEYFEAIEDSVIYYINKKSYLYLVELSTDFAKFSIDELLTNLCEYQNQCEFLRTLSAQDRLKYIENKYPYLLTRVKQKYLCSFLNIEATYLSKLMNPKSAETEQKIPD